MDNEFVNVRRVSYLCEVCYCLGENYPILPWNVIIEIPVKEASHSVQAANQKSTTLSPPPSRPVDECHFLHSRRVPMSICFSPFSSGIRNAAGGYFGEPEGASLSLTSC